MTCALGQQLEHVTTGGPFRAPDRASLIRPATVSAGSFLFVPITPEGPRLIHPVTYSPLCTVRACAQFDAGIAVSRARHCVRSRTGAGLSATVEGYAL